MSKALDDFLPLFLKFLVEFFLDLNPDKALEKNLGIKKKLLKFFGGFESGNRLTRALKEKIRRKTSREN